jgi:flagellar protein FliL
VATAAKVEPTPVAQAPAKSRPGTLIAAALALLIVGGAATWFLMRGSLGEPSAKPATEFLAVDPWFTVNLREENDGRYLQVGLVFEVAGKRAKEQLTARLPIVRSKIILAASAKTGRELKTREGKSALAAEILSIARGEMDGVAPTDVEAVHFSVFVIQ